MTSGVKSTIASSAYINNDLKKTRMSENKSVSSSQKEKSVDKTKVQQLRSDIESGKYKVDIEALAKKIVEELL